MFLQFQVYVYELQLYMVQKFHFLLENEYLKLNLFQHQ